MAKMYYEKDCDINYLNGKKIAHSTMSNMIANPKYKGYYVGNKVKVVDMFTKKQKFLPPEEWVMFKDETGEIVPARLAVIGFPIAHSKSPAMQQAALDAAGIRARYIRIQAAPEEFGEVVRLLRKRGFTGANVTVPHKQAALSLIHI